MKCLACDCVLTDLAATRKFTDSNMPVDLCDKCLAKADIRDLPTYVNPEFEELEWSVDDEMEFYSEDEWYSDDEADEQ